MTESAQAPTILATEPNPTPIIYKAPWVEECCRMLTLWWAAGFSASTVAGMFGAAGFVFSRNAIIGKVYRMHLPPHRVLTGLRPAKPRRKAAMIAREKLRERVGEAATALAATPEIICKPVTFTELAECHCRWPLDGGRYCGADRSWRFDLNNQPFRAPYCAGHYARAYHPPKSRLPRIA